jgi:hypothetical protein
MQELKIVVMVSSEWTDTKPLSEGLKIPHLSPQPDISLKSMYCYKRGFYKKPVKQSPATHVFLIPVNHIVRLQEYRRRSMMSASIISWP